MLRIAITGAAGRMGREVIKAVSSESDMTVVAAVDPARAGTTVEDGHGGAVEVLGDLSAALAARPDVLVDFTQASQVEANVREALASGVDCVVGTTGVGADVLAGLADGAPAGVCLFYAPNFAIGAVLMMRFAEEAARFLPHAEIIELHHDRKLDAPSGTAMRTATLIAAARTEIPSVPGRETEVAEGARGAFVDDVPVHSVRLPGLVAHQEVLFGGPGQTLSIRHDSIDRTSFMPGVVLAIRNVGGLSGLVIGLDALLDG
ncbi:MAG: 4-hydroxy-tetrahydrodipicolinate reductase [Coriobacteriia bacterium]